MIESSQKDRFLFFVSELEKKKKNKQKCQLVLRIDFVRFEMKLLFLMEVSSFIVQFLFL